MDLSQEILDCPDLRREEVDVPQWNRKVWVQELGLQESMLAYGSIKPDDDGKLTLDHTEIAQVVAYGVIDPATGKRVFTDKDVPKLARKNPKALMSLYIKITALSSTVEAEIKN